MRHVSSIAEADAPEEKTALLPSPAASSHLLGVSHGNYYNWVIIYYIVLGFLGPYNGESNGKENGKRN